MSKYTPQTTASRVLDYHINTKYGTKTVCVSTCLNYLGIGVNEYRYTQSYKGKRLVDSYEGVLRKFGWAVRSRKTEFKVKSGMTLTELRSNIKASKYSDTDLMLVTTIQKTKAHLIILDGNGKTVIDTAPTMRWKVGSVKQVFKNI